MSNIIQAELEVEQIFHDFQTFVIKTRHPSEGSYVTKATVPYSSAIRQKGESQNGCYMKTKHAKCSKNRVFLKSWHGQARVRIKG